MKRRLLLKQVMLAAAAAALAPSCTFDKKKASIALHHLTIDGDKEELLASISETILPARTGAQCTRPNEADGS